MAEACQPRLCTLYSATLGLHIRCQGFHLAGRVKTQGPTSGPDKDPNKGQFSWLLFFTEEFFGPAGDTCRELLPQEREWVCISGLGTA